MIQVLIGVAVFLGILGFLTNLLFVAPQQPPPLPACPVIEPFMCPDGTVITIPDPVTCEMICPEEVIDTERTAQYKALEADIVITNPRPNEILGIPFTFSGQVNERWVRESQLQFVIRSQAGDELGHGFAEAQPIATRSGWYTFYTDAGVFSPVGIARDRERMTQGSIVIYVSRLDAPPLELSIPVRLAP